MASRAAYGPNPNAGVNVNADNGWGPYKWPGGVPGSLLGTVTYQQANGAKQLVRVTVRRELVGLFTLAFALADRKHGYQVWAERGGQPWGPWSYENRPISGTSTASNHSRGRAIDVNAPLNPQSYTFQSDMPPAMVADWERIGLCWGGRYEGGVKFDTMHFEYGYSPADVARHTALAQQLLGDDPGRPNQPEDDMPYSEADLKRIIGEVVDSKINAIGDRVWRQVIEEYKGGKPPWSIMIDAVDAANAVAAKIPDDIGTVIWSQLIKEYGQGRRAWDLLGQASGVPPTVTPPPTTYTVQDGDTLGGIAKRFGVTVDQLVAWNGLANPDSIDVGQVLKVSDPGKG
jgi:hypothetical protein